MIRSAVYRTPFNSAGIRSVGRGIDGLMLNDLARNQRSLKETMAAVRGRPVALLMVGIQYR